MNIVFSNQYAVSEYLNQNHENYPKDFKKAAKLYTQYNELRKYAVLDYFKILLYNDFVRRINISKWENENMKTHLLNLIHAIHNNTVK